MVSEEILLKIIRNATYACSKFNSQPWLFIYGHNYITIKPDKHRKLKRIDENNRYLFLSLGCCIENTLLTAMYFGFDGEVSFCEKSSSVTIYFEPVATKTYIHSLQIEGLKKCTYNFTEDRITWDVLDKLSKFLQSFRDQKVILISSKDQLTKKQLKSIIQSDYEFSKPSVKEGLKWIRFSQTEAKQKGDGIWTKYLGWPDLGRIIGVICFRLLSMFGQNRISSYVANQNKPLQIILYSCSDDFMSLIELGRNFQQLLIKLADFNLTCSSIDLPALVKVHKNVELNSQFISKGSIIMDVHVGYPKNYFPAYRRKINEYIIKK